jgi:ElaB/YqjD/DUF883 family membrane-anchored ribosome-binding protein
MSSQDTSDRQLELEHKYDYLINRLNEERSKVERDLVHEYRNVRRYVRAHPEEGLGLALAGGFVLGLLVGKLTKK